MFKRGEVYENPATGIKAVIQVGTEETEGEQLVVDLYARKCGAGSVLHLHPVIYERLTIVSGRVGVDLERSDLYRRSGFDDRDSTGSGSPVVERRHLRSAREDGHSTRRSL